MLAPWLTRAERPLHRSSLALGGEGAHGAELSPEPPRRGWAQMVTAAPTALPSEPTLLKAPSVGSRLLYPLSSCPTPALVMGRVALSTMPSRSRWQSPVPMPCPTCLSHENGEVATQMSPRCLAGQCGLEATPTPGAWSSPGQTASGQHLCLLWPWSL